MTTQAQELADTIREIGDLERQLDSLKAQRNSYLETMEKVRRSIVQYLADQNLHITPKAIPDLTRWPTSDQLTGLFDGMSQIHQNLQNAENKRAELENQIKSP